jgi:GTP pyrophosphokinase
MLTSLAQCCNPVPGDEIIGFVTRTRGVSIHRKDCVNIINEDEKERLIEVDWGQAGLTYPVSVVVDAWNRVGLARDITVVVAA